MMVNVTTEILIRKPVAVVAGYAAARRDSTDWLRPCFPS